MRTLEGLEGRAGFRLPDGAYWYDQMSGASGRWGGPTAVFLPPGLDPGGPLPADASGGGTEVFINGRELHPNDLLALSRVVGAPIAPGRYWVDGQGNAGPDGRPVVINLAAAARQHTGSWGFQHDSGTGSARDNMSVSGDGQTTCVSTGGYSRCTGGN